MLRSHLLIGVCVFWAAILQAQKTEIHKLLGQASEMVFYNPKEAKAIAAHSLKLTENPAQKAEAFYIGAMASYIMGQYDEALNQAFETKKLLKKNKDAEINKQSIALIHRIFDRLQLSDYQKDYWPQNLVQDALQTEDLLMKVQFYAERNRQDSVSYFLSQTEPHLNHHNPGYFEAMYNGLKGDLYFGNKAFSEALAFYQKADSIESKLNNPFLGAEIHKRFTASYLAIDSIAQYQQGNEWVKQLINESSGIENKASNQAYILMTKSFDETFQQKEKTYSTIFALLGALAALGVVLKIIFGIRNRNKEKTLTQMLNYLKNHEAKIPETEPETSEKEAASKSGNLLKESEEQILSGLSKFEKSTRFTQKDMSLGKLAARLSTNTKYLSEVINRHKGKNFNAYINELRVNYIIWKLKSNSAYLHYKVSYLADECGFSSHSSFATVFKSIVGVSPSVFIDLIKEESEKEMV
ncbi:MAG: helix-turn-helix domain-containing protein [Weeksellaceae bacterium]